jgi:G3E family GTPase
MEKEIQSGAVVKPAPIPITVIAGFLGAGKTTLLNYILTAEHGRRIGVLVNDFGSINVDAELITDVSDEMITLANGCICCMIRMDLIQAVLKMAEQPDRPEQIVIESSGVADPAGIVKSFLEPEIWGMVQLDAVVTVVDAEQSLDLPIQEARLARAQVVGGDLILLNKVDLVDDEKLAQVHDWINSIRPGVQVFETTQARLPMEILLGTGAAGAKQLEEERDPELAVHVHEVSTSHDHDHEHELLFDTWTFTSQMPLQLTLMQELLKHLPSTLFRVKGFVYAIEEPESRMVVQLVGRRATVTPTRSWGAEPPQTRLVFISRHSTVNYPAIEKALRNCQVEM